MYRLLIVDDEPAIVDGLQQHFQEKEEWELDLCKAYSADEALEIAKKTKIDLLISDIRMPGKSGLQLIDDVLYYWPACRVILLTGHSEFDYAYKAIQKNVDSYILKMEGIEVIHKAVSAVLDQFEEERRNLNMLKRASLKLTVAEPLLKKELFEALLIGDDVAAIGRSEWYDGPSLLIDLGEPLIMLAGMVDHWPEKTTYMRKLELYYSVQNLFSELLPSQIRSETVIHDRSVLCWFVQPADADLHKFAEQDGGTDWQALGDYLKGMLEPLQNSCRSELGISLSFVVGRGAVKRHEIGKEFDLIKAAFKQRAAFGPEMAVIDLDQSDEWFKGEAGKYAAPSAGDYHKKLHALEKCLDDGDAKGASALTGYLVGTLKNETNPNYVLGKERYYSLLLVYLSALNKMDFSDKSLHEVRLASLSVFESEAEWGAIEEQLIRLCELICRMKKEQIENSEHRIVERVHRFVNENLGNDLSLARIAEVVYFNPSYLSRFYKQLTGRNLSDYINEARRDAAIDLLVHTQLKVNEIALRLGFESPSYFTSFFRKMTGSSPQEYRETAIMKGK
ncbi:response regulator [Paenibacillus arenilitoris]|uniref:Helix-turn-helix domain-containing protein n=1 Tax=Paenibacillus arenilitoris TaxID=2772299 RepID=A0A927CKJ0_9BACL|nr:response regulator [Paenibacillus arenilitoris]MBD2867876.1 helix-turn-helix domain-containing protein [Paenibacillus arenilitoris]